MAAKSTLAQLGRERKEQAKPVPSETASLKAVPSPVKRWEEESAGLPAISTVSALELALELALALAEATLSAAGALLKLLPPLPPPLAGAGLAGGRVAGRPSAGCASGVGGPASPTVLMSAARTSLPPCKQAKCTAGRQAQR